MRLKKFTFILVSEKLPKIRSETLIAQILERLHTCLLQAGIFRRVFNLCNLLFNLWNRKERLLKKSTLIIFILVFLIISYTVFAKDLSGISHKLLFFYTFSCHKCIEVKNEFMLQIEKKFKDKIQIQYLDIDDIQNYKLLHNLKEQYGLTQKMNIPIVFFEGNFLSGEVQIKRNLIRVLEGLEKPVIKKKEPVSFDLILHFKTLIPLTVITTGLMDGLNPCAFTAIVFFISFLAMQGYKRKQIITIGLSFIFAVFITYLLIGMGLFGFLYRLREFWLVARIINFSIGIFSIILGIICIYDSFRFKQTKDTEGIILQLPTKIKNQIHKIIGLHYRIHKQSGGPVLKRHILGLFLTALITGFLVSILEGICTGQLYLPAISFIFKTSHLKLEALVYLLLYNFMFVIPLLLIFLFALLGVTSEQFSKFFRRHLLSIKIFMAIIFFILGTFSIWEWKG